MPAYASVCQRMRTCLKRIQPMPNVPLAYVSVYQRMSDIFHTLYHTQQCDRPFRLFISIGINLSVIS